MSSKSTKPTMKQSTLPFGASKSTAAANKTKKEVSESSTSTSKRSTRSGTSKTNAEEHNVDDIELSQDIPSSESETEKDDVEEFPEEKRESGKSAVITVKRETRASTKAKAKAEAAVSPAKVLGVPVQPKAGQKEAAVEKKDVEEEAALRPNLNIKNKAYDQISRDTKMRRGFAHTIHPTTEVDGKDVPLNRVDEILRLFDMSYEYGPCVGMTRLERWERANKLGLSPPSEIYDILTTKEGSEETRYSQNVLYGRV